MVPLLGILIVFGAIISGFALENGRLVPLLQPSELIIICGAALGTMVTANPWPVLKDVSKRILLVFRGPPGTRDRYLATLVMLHATFDFGRKQGMARLEEEMEKPPGSGIFVKHAAVLEDRGVESFIRDTLRIATLGVVPAPDLDAMLSGDIEIRRRKMSSHVESLAALADSLPGLGIVAAVLGVVITMGGLRDSPAEIGLKVGTALVGTFLGILLSYGVVAPIAANLATVGETEAQYYETLRAGLIAFARGMPPLIAAECARRNIPPDLRPPFEEMEKACKGGMARRKAA